MNFNDNKINILFFIIIYIFFNLKNTFLYYNTNLF